MKKIINEARMEGLILDELDKALGGWSNHGLAPMVVKTNGFIANWTATPLGNSEEATAILASLQDEYDIDWPAT